MDLVHYFRQTIKEKASDLHLVAGSRPALRIGGDLVRVGTEPLEAQELEAAVFSLIDAKTRDRFIRKRELDFALELFGTRFRINLHFQEGKLGLTARRIPEAVPNPEDINFNEVIYGLTHLKDGLILVTGPSGSGKSTTLAAMINIINRERRAHIITIEDPIEFMFKEEQSIIEQREVGTDTTNFATGLKYALRQDPNVIMVGEMRDLETIKAALTAAETGHLVISTLHTSTAPEAAARIVNVFPAHQQQQVLIQLSSILRAVIAQQIIPKKGSGLTVAREIMINNRAIANLIRRNQFEQIYSIIQTSHNEGMITMNKAIDKLYNEGEISEQVAKNRKRDLETLALYY